jgi:heme A synthase
MSDALIVGSLYFVISALLLSLFKKRYGERSGTKKWLYFSEALALVLIGKGVITMLLLTFNGQTVSYAHMLVVSFLAAIVYFSYKSFHKAL